MKKLLPLTIMIFASAFVTVMLFGLNMGMDMKQDGTMSGCTFDQSITCPMNYQEHIKHWQQIFTATQPTQITILALFVAIAFGGAALLFFSLLKWQRHAQWDHYLPQAVHKKREIIAKLSDPILQALSNGILNPRLYSFANGIR